MNSQVSLRISVYLCLAGLAAGCAEAVRRSSAPAKTQAGESLPPPRRTEIVHLSSGERVLVSVEVEPSGFLLPVVIERQVSTDGTLGPLWGTQRAQIAGLTLDEAACTIRLALITNYFGFIFRKVSVCEVQPPGCTKPRDCGQCENRMPPARGR
jgi:hypothetical protein